MSLDYLGYYHSGSLRPIGKVLDSDYSGFQFYTLRLLERRLEQGSLVVVDLGDGLVIGLVSSMRNVTRRGFEPISKTEMGLTDMISETGEVEDLVTTVYTCRSIGYYSEGVFGKGGPPKAPLIYQLVYEATDSLVKDFYRNTGFDASYILGIALRDDWATLVNHFKYLSRHLSPEELKRLFISGLKVLGEADLSNRIPAYIREVGSWLRLL